MSLTVPNQIMYVVGKKLCLMFGLRFYVFLRMYHIILGLGLFPRKNSLCPVEHLKWRLFQQKLQN